ncbi:hypothetical protein ABL78_3217 [Leptomonas seymouri]|uniref:Uncharacterized protein n=1 Tax=Leptomonas seymouri TaxID=5684 RepID=A0A0N0P6J1_LEPSE|nr:hypothetical protein ABL78_3217 [Leptomonas seymouri]|eukprot:KPI87679.1 hypothetical protein ABL78_3217 [Leptomonas seymouri]
MSIRAVGWLQSKLGLNIGVRGADSDGSGHTGNFANEELAGFTTTENRSSNADPVACAGANGASEGAEEGTLASMASQWEAKIGGVWRQANDTVTQFWNTNVRTGSSGNDRNDPFGFGSGGTHGGGGDNPELDENGLPLTKNWYYFDRELGRWTVSADAPQSVQREYYEQLQEAERERLGQKTVVAPPPPPLAAQRPLASVSGGAPPPPQSTKAAPGGLFGAGGARGSHSPQYALPDYFGSNAPAHAAPAPQPPYPGAYSLPQDHVEQLPHLLAAAPFPPPPTTATTGVSAPAPSGYASHSSRSGSSLPAPIHSSSYPSASPPKPQDLRPPMQTANSPPPTSATGLPAGQAGAVGAPYLPAAASHLPHLSVSPSQPAPLPGPVQALPAPVPVSHNTPSPSNSCTHASYPAPSLSPQDVYGASSQRSNLPASPPATNVNMLPSSHSAIQQYPPPLQQPQYQQPNGACSPPQMGHDVYGSCLPSSTGNVPPVAPVPPPTQVSNSYSTHASAPGHFGSNAGFHTQGSPAGSTGYSAAPSSTGYHYDSTATSSNSASGAQTFMHSPPASAWKTQPSGPQLPPQQQQQQQQAPSWAPTAPAPSNPFAQRPGANPVTVVAPVTTPPAPTLALPTPPQPPYATQQPVAPSSGGDHPPGNVAPAAPAPVAAPTNARLPMPPSFKPFSLS